MSDYRELHQMFADSPYGLQLEAQTRFNDFKPDFVDTEMWTRLLGNDVNNLYHMPHTYELAHDFAFEGRLSEDSTDRLLTTAITHDWGEAAIGDIALPDKTGADNLAEYQAYRGIAKDLLGADGEGLADKVLPVLSMHNEGVGRMFNAVEYIGYCTTALRAGRVATGLAHGFVVPDLTRVQTQELMGGLLSLEKAVSVKNFPVLERHITHFPFIKKVLEGHLYV